MDNLFKTYQIDDESADTIEKYITTNVDIQWGYQNNVTFERQHIEEQRKEYDKSIKWNWCPGFSSRFVHEGITNPRCDTRFPFYKGLQLPTIRKAIGDAYKDYRIWRCQTWIYPSVADGFNVPHCPHVDLTTRRSRSEGSKLCPNSEETGEGNLVMLYYVNDCDGDNYFYKIKDGHENDDDVNTNYYNPKKLSLAHIESPKKGKLLLFDGDTIHASSSPSKNLRMTLNINILPPKDD
tara:strand:+ start:269 stop:979 length:711 start_codon:yes stop_codon:yes gene_type:complete